MELRKLRQEGTSSVEETESRQERGVIAAQLGRRREGRQRQRPGNRQKGGGIGGGGG